MNIFTPFYFANLGVFCGCITMVIAYILAQTMNVMQDKPSDAGFKLHKKNTPLCGGISIFIAYIVVVLGGIEIRDVNSTNKLLFYNGDFYEYAGLHFYIACCIVLCAGIIKDLNNRAKMRMIFCVQILGFCIFYILLLQLNIQSHSMILVFMPSCIFLFIATNGINTIDGIHGNAALCGMQVLFSLCCVSYHSQSNFVVFAASVLLGILCIFILFNYPFGRMFLGDNGAFLIGFCIGALILLCVLYYGINIWYCIALLLYPMCAMLSSLVIKVSSGARIWHILWQPNAFHLHTMMWRHFGYYTTIIIHLVLMCFIAVITYYHKDNIMIFISSAVFCVIYAVCFIIFYRKNANLYSKA